MKDPLRLFRHCCLLGLLLTLPVTAAQSDTAKARKALAQVQQDIQQTEQQKQQQLSQINAAEQQLKAADLALAAATSAVAEQQNQLKILDQQLQQLKTQQQQLEQQRQAQQQLLAIQVKAAYQVGGHDYTQMLLNQQNALKLERLLTYYQYFNNARMQQLEALKATYTELDTLAQQQAKTVQQQQLRLEELKTQQHLVVSARNDQQSSVRSLKELLSKQEQQLDYLKSNEKTLLATIAKLKTAAANRRLKYQGKKQGDLPWPVQGELGQQFGARQGGGMTASGIIIKAESGSTVRAVANGQVIYADWLKGYGWVIVLDHGNGLMSLYGHNQSLLKAPGNIIQAGDSVALVGQSGGQDKAGLYFEIRQKGTAVDPLSWLRNP